MAVFISRELQLKLKQILAQILTLAFIINLAANVYAADIPDPETFFGHKPGADFKLIRWEKIVEYYQLLGRESNRIQVEELGKTTLQNPFLLAVISSPENLSQLEKYKDSAKKLAQAGSLKRRPAAWPKKEKPSY